MERNRWGWISAALLALVLVPAFASAQANQVGQLAGEVKDATGGILPGATVTLTSVERGFSRIAVTDSSGKFMFAVVPIGRYAVNVKMPSFQTVTLTDNLVETERTTTVSVTLNVAGVEVATTVVGETPIVDSKNQTLETRMRADEFSKLAVGRSYQALMGMVPGVVGTGNVNSHGALTSNNIFMFDGVNTTDPTTGTFAANLNFEAIQEMVVRTSAVGVEYGRGTGAVVDVITRSGTNKFEGSFKYYATNDDWNKQNSTKDEVTGLSNERKKFDKLNSRYAGTVGGPILKNRAWFFFTYEDARITSPQRETNADTSRGFPKQNYIETTKSPFLTARATVQLAPSHTVWVKYSDAPTDGFINDYWLSGPFSSAELNALTFQNQSGSSIAAQYNGVLGTKWTASLMASSAQSVIDVFPYSTAGAIEGGAPFEDYNDSRMYNGATFDGKVDRPRTQVSGAMEYFTKWMGNDHAVKFGLDWQDMESVNDFKYPTNTYFGVTGFNPNTKTYTPVDKYIFVPGASTSTGTQTAFFVRDKFQMGSRVSLEAGLRIENQSGTSDVGAGTVDTLNYSPRVSGSYALTADSKTLLVASAGRFYDNILQGFSDAFANVPQQESYSYYQWTGTAYEFVNKVSPADNTFKPDLDVQPRHLDEFTVGADRQISNVIGIGGRFIWRSWGNFIDDVRTLSADGTINRVVANVDEAERTYKGFEVTLDKRFSNNWAANGSYTFSRTRGNHFGTDFTALADYAGENCRQTADTTLGDANGVFPCSQVQANLSGRPAFDRPHLIKFAGSYRKPIKSVDLTAGLSGSAISKATFSRTRTVTVLRPGTLSSAGATQTYNYDGAGSERIESMLFSTDLAIEAAYRAMHRTEFALKFETFNLFNNEEKTAVNNTTWCGNASAPAGSACATARTNFGTATARGSFLAPRTYRLSLQFRF